MNYNKAMNRKEQKNINEIQEQTTNNDGLLNAGDRSSGKPQIICVMNDTGSYNEVDGKPNVK